MILHYLLFALRSLLRHKINSAINIFGLTVGLTCFVLIMLYVRYENSFDTFHSDVDNLYRVSATIETADGTKEIATASGPVAPALASDFPEVLAVARVRSMSTLVANGDIKYQEDRMFFAESSFFDVFSYQLISGDYEMALKMPSTIVLTKSSAIKYFGDKNPMGKTLTIDGDEKFSVTGIVEDPPANTHLPFDMLVSMSTMGSFVDEWIWSALTYVKLRPGSAASLQEKLPDFVTRNMGSSRLPNESTRAMTLQPITDLHLHSNRAGEPGAPGSLSKLYFVSVTAFMILLIACVNFVNLATAQAAKRAGEVGVRKAIGGTRLQLMFQFLSESIVISLCATILSFSLCQALEPVLHTYSGSPIDVDIIETPGAIVSMLSISLVVGLLAGIYPAILISRFQPTGMLRRVQGTQAGGALMRKGLIAFQFVISIALIAGTITVYRQLSYIQAKDLGYSKEQVLVLSFGDDSDVQDHIESVATELLNSPYVTAVAASSHLPGQEPGTRPVQADVGGQRIDAEMNLLSVDKDFLTFYQIELAAGRTFSTNDATGSWIINEVSAKLLGFKTAADAIGTTITQAERTGVVVGVVKDFHYASLHKRIGSLLIRMRPKSLSYFSLKIIPGQIRTAVTDVQDRWKKLAIHRPFDYSFMDDQFELQYHSDTKFGQLFIASAVIAVTLACLGLFGLIMFTTRQRTKEIGIRKVLGASVTSVIALLSKEFAVLIAIAAVIATPTAYWVMDTWLENFAYHLTMTWWIFALAGGLAFGVAFVTVGLQSRKAALANPAEALRTE